MSFHVPERYRVKIGQFRSNASNGNNGAFFVKGPGLKDRTPLKIIASDGVGWEHVSVSLPNRCPSWDEMCFVKSLFWDDEDVVMQLHPAKENWISNHSFCLHLWRPLEATIPLPPNITVGIKEVGTLV